MNNLHTVYLEVTNSCIKDCKHCFNRDINNLYQSELNLSEIQTIIDTLSDFGVNQMKIVGGEPILRSDIYEILDYLEQKKMKYIIFTDSYDIINAVDILKEMKYLTEIRVSIDGNKEVHDYIRVTGDFQESIEAMSVLVSAGIPVYANYTINKMNLSCIEECYNLLRKKNIPIKFGLVKLCNSVVFDSKLAFIDNVIDTRYFIDELNKIKQSSSELYQNIVDNIHDSDAFIIEQKSSEFGNIGCYAGQMSCVIDSQGDIYPCGMVKGNNMFKYGNVLSDEFKECWKRMNEEWSSIKPSYECTSCDLGTRCTGGCRANAIFHTGKLDDKDPNCLLYCNSLYQFG